MQMKMQIIATTRRFLSAKLTSRSIIEENSALHDGAFADAKATFDDSRVALLIIDLDVAGLERPRRDFDEDALAVVFQDQRRCRHRCNLLRRREEAHGREHVGL